MTNTTARQSMISGVFQDRYDAIEAHSFIKSLGYADSDINFLMSDSTRKKFDEEHHATHPAGTHALEGVATGGTIGTAIGATVAAIAAIGTSVLLPGVGWVAGPILAALAGGGAGAVTGGLIGGLVGLGIPESNAKAYEAALLNGGVVIGVHTRDAKDQAQIRKRFEELRGENIVTVAP